MNTTIDEKIKEIILELDIKTIKDWRLKVDSEILHNFGVPRDGIELSRVRTIIRRLSNPKNKKRRRYQKQRARPRA